MNIYIYCVIVGLQNNEDETAEDNSILNHRVKL